MIFQFLFKRSICSVSDAHAYPRRAQPFFWVHWQICMSFRLMLAESPFFVVTSNNRVCVMQDCATRSLHSDFCCHSPQA